jgi:hypothetical protein
MLPRPVPNFGPFQSDTVTEDVLQARNQLAEQELITVLCDFLWNAPRLGAVATCNLQQMASSSDRLAVICQQAETFDNLFRRYLGRGRVLYEL